MHWYMALPYELFIRLYRKKHYRRLLKLFFSKQNPEGWIFLVGCYNAGTTIIKDSIATHPNVTTPPIEGDVLTSYLSNFEDNGLPRGMFGNSYLITRHRQKGILDADAILSDWRPWIKPGKYFLEKSISNSVRINLIRRTFPGAKFVCVVRNPTDVVKGIQKRSQPHGLASKIFSGCVYPDSFLLRQWAFIYKAVLEDKETDTAFVSYEDFVNNPAANIRKLYQFLGLPAVEVNFENDELLICGRKLKIRTPIETLSIDSDLQQMLENRIWEIDNQLRKISI